MSARNELNSQMKCPNCNCQECEKCISILNLMLDNEASEAQIAFFNSHIEECNVCLGHCNIEKQIRTLLKTKVQHRKVPIELIREIKEKIIR